MAYVSIQTIGVCVNPNDTAAVNSLPVGFVRKTGTTWCPVNQALYTGETALIDKSMASNLDVVLQPFDYSQASGFFALGFSSVLIVYFVALKIGAVISIFKRH